MLTNNIIYHRQTKTFYSVTNAPISTGSTVLHESGEIITAVGLGQCELLHDIGAKVIQKVERASVYSTPGIHYSII